MTDANINLLSYEWCKYAQEFLHLLQSYSFIPTIDKPTRVLNKSATLIDNIFINNYDSMVYSGNIVSDISDHYTQFCVCNALGNKSKFMPPKVKLRDYSKFSENQFLNHLAQLNWESVEGDDINTSFSVFYNKLDRVVNKHAPLKSVSKRKAKQLSKPWISRGIKTSIRKKNELYYSGDMAKYRLYRNKIITLTRLSKKLYYHNFFETNMSNIKNTWKGINLLINGKTRGDNVITALKRPGNGGLSHNADEIPNIMNSFFSSIDPNLAARIPQAQKHFSSFLPKQNNAGSFLFKPVTPIEIEAEILSIPLNKVYGLYSCPTRILKSASKIISSPLCKLINKSIEIGAYPSKLKHSKVVPVYIGEDKTDPSNYGAISLLSVFNRIFEKNHVS